MKNFVFLLLFLFVACKNTSTETREPGYEYYFHRNGKNTDELKLKINSTKTEVLEAFYKPSGQTDYMPLQILSKNENPLFYLVRYGKEPQALRLFTDFGAGASLFFTQDKFFTFNKEYFCYSEDKKKVLITSGLPSFTPFFLTAPDQSYVYSFIPSQQESSNVATNPDYPDSIVFEGTFSNGKKAKITVFQEPNTQKYLFILEMDAEKTIFLSEF
jgi:hypothetical protein